MKISSWLVKRPITGCLVLLLAAPFSHAAAAAPRQQTAPATPAATVASGQSEGAGAASAALPASDPPAPAQNGNPGNSSNDAQPAQDQQKTGAIKPLGTAAAPYEQAAGATASRPAGAVIAPARQRRVRIIFIRVALLVGAGVAIGTVVALSHSSPSRWP